MTDLLLKRGLILTLDVGELLGGADKGRTGLLTRLPACLVARGLINGLRFAPSVSTRKERFVFPDFFLELRFFERRVAFRRLFFAVLERI